MPLHVRLRLLPLVAVVALAVPAGAQREIPAPIKRYFDLVHARYSGDRARDVVAFMDRYFRMPGNTGFDASLDRVASILRSAGYVAEDSAKTTDRLVYRFDRRPMQPLAWDPIDASLAIVGQPKPLLQYATNRNMLAINSFSTPDTGVVGELVYLASDSAAVLDRANVRGKIVLIERPVSRVFQVAVQQRGAIGALGYNLPAYTKPAEHPSSIQFTSVAYDTARKSWGIPLSRGALDALKVALAKGPVSLRVKTKSRHFPSAERTLVAEVRGSEKPAERFVFSAHAQEPGANDNASGVGALSEIARVLADLTKSGQAAPKRTITMLFGNEIAQTRNYLAADTARTRNVLWGLSLDMVGEDTKKTGGTFLIEKMPDPSAVWTRGDEKHSEWGGSPLQKDRIVPHYYNDYLLNRCLDQASYTNWVVRTNPFEGGSDHTPFLSAKKPGVLFWHFTDVFYHTDGDRLENVSAQTLANTGACALVSALTLVNADRAMATTLVAEFERGAVKRLDVETALSKAALAGGAAMAAERDIIETWTDFYVRSLETMTDIEVGGVSPEVRRAIDAAKARVRAAGDERLRQLGAR